MTRKSRRALHIGLLSAFTVLIVGSQARTGWLLLGTDLVSFGLLRFLFLPREGRINKPAAAIAASLLLLASSSIFITYAANFDGIVAGVVNGTSVSDLSRLAYQVTALKIFASSPIFGVGLGQFAFNAAASMPSWGFLSPEVGPALIYPDAPWPNTYSLYARLAAELGLIGLLGWVAIWSTLIISVCRAARTYAGFRRPVPVIAYAIIMSCIGILVTGVTTDTFRTPMIGITLGAGACFIARSKQLARERVLNRALSELSRGAEVTHDSTELAGAQSLSQP
jgi:O-antigen ligase